MDQNFEFELDAFGQLPLLNIYTQISLCYSTPDASSHAVIVDTLTDGLKRLATSFPWIAGQVINESSSAGSSGVYKIKPLESIPRLVVKDLRQDPSVPTMDDLRRANFPSRMLDESYIAPRRTIPGSPDEAGLDSMPVFLLQATFITGGLILTFVAHHKTMDMTGQGQVIDLFSKACRNEPFTSEELSSGNLPRRNIIPLLDASYEPGPEIAHQIITQPPASATQENSNVDPPSAPPKSSWAYVTFPVASLNALKSLANKTLPPSTTFVSTDDALSAFIWQSVARARLPRLSPADQSTFGRAINVRRYLDIPETYPGMIQNMARHTWTYQQLISEPLGVIAAQMRSVLGPNLGYLTRALATVMDRAADKGVVSFTGMIDVSKDIMLSSWSRLGCYELDFGLGLGKPVSVRRPQFIPFEGLLYLMPRALDGEIALMLCLRDEDLERLRADAEFAKYGRYDG